MQISANYILIEYLYTKNIRVVMPLLNMLFLSIEIHTNYMQFQIFINI